MIRNTSSDELEHLWDDIVSRHRITVPFHQFRWHKTWHDVLGNNYPKHFLMCGDRLIAPLTADGTTMILSGGYEVADYLDLIGSEEDKRRFWPEILEYIRHQGILRLHLRNIPEESGTLTYFQSLSDQAVKPVIKEEDVTPILALPRTWSEYQESLDRKSRHELNRKIRKFEREYPDAIIRYGGSNRDSVDTLLSVMRVNPEKASFLTGDMVRFFRDITVSFGDSTEFQFLEHSGRIVSALMSLRNASSIYLYNSGYLPEVRGAGFYLKAKSIERSITSGMTEYNFLQGNERYKYELGGKDKRVFEITYDLG